MKNWPAALALASLALSLPAQAHRLDEYLQATRIDVSPGRIELRFDLTPGVAILPNLLPAIDTDANGRFSRQERIAYARRFLADLHLALDGHTTPLELRQLTFPPRAEFLAGQGAIRLRAVAKLEKLTPGTHALVFRNHHLPDLSVYLVNALRPDPRRIVISRQVRNDSQSEYRLEFEAQSPGVGPMQAQTRHNPPRVGP